MPCTPSNCTTVPGTPVYNVSKGYQAPAITCKTKERKECFMELLIDTKSVRPSPKTKYEEAVIRDSPSELKEGWTKTASSKEFTYSLDESSLLSIQHCSTSEILPPGFTLLTYTLVFAPGTPIKWVISLGNWVTVVLWASFQHSQIFYGSKQHFYYFKTAKTMKINWKFIKAKTFHLSCVI